MTKACMICGGDEASGEQLLEAPCQRHWVCTDDVSSFFEHATENESLYPPKCCGQIFLLDLFESYVPFEVQWAYQMKEQGEYSVLAKYRVYCASPACSSFLSPSTHVQDPNTNITYAMCQNGTCGKITCTSCKTLLDGVDNHTCGQDEDYQKFKQTATEKGFQECPTCASTVELAEACNHISCECGGEFCYICGEQWPGIHGCPHYGPAIYDDEDYNQDGYHRITGINREGRTRREQRRLDGEEDGDEDEEDSDEEEEQEQEEEDDERDDPAWDVLQHVEPDVRAMFAALPDEDREMFLFDLQFQLLEERGITFPDVNDDTNIEPFDNQDRDTAADDSSDNEDDGDAAEDDITQGAQPTVDDDAPVAPEPGGGIDPEVLNTSSPDEEQPSTPVVGNEQGGEERPMWKGPPGGWPDDEEL